MFDRILNPTPTIYKWDTFWVGFLPSLILPFISFLIFYAITAVTAGAANGVSFPFSVFIATMHGSTVFLHTASLCCIPNAAIFFFLIQRNYYNASRAVVITTMLYVIAIVIKEAALSS